MNNSIGKSLFYTEKYSDDSEKEDYICFSSSFIQKIENIEQWYYFPYKEYSDTKSTLNVEIPLSPYIDIFTNSKSNEEEDKENENIEKIKLEKKEIKNNRKIKFCSSKYGIIRRGKIPIKKRIKKLLLIIYKEKFKLALFLLLLIFQMMFYVLLILLLIRKNLQNYLKIFHMKLKKR